MTFFARQGLIHTLIRRMVLAIVVLALCTAPLAGQGAAIPLGTLPLGFVFNIDLGAGIREIAPILAQFPEVYKGFNYNFTVVGGTLPPGLTLTADGLLSGTLTTPGSYNFTINEHFEFLFADGLGIPSFPFDEPIALSLVVTGATGPGAGSVSVAPGGLSFNVVQGGAAAQQTLTIANPTATPFAFTASASGGSFLQSPSGGTAPPFGQTSVGVSVNPSGLAPGTYTGTIRLSGGTTTLSVPVVLTVTGAGPLLTLSQNGFFFQGQVGGAAAPTQSFAVGNGGTGSLNWNATASTQTGGNWLAISPSTGTSTSTASPTVGISVNPAGLAAGTYYGQIQVSSSGVANSPQVLTVVFSVAAANKPPDPDVRPTALIFVGAQGGADPAPQTIQITNLAATPISYTSSSSFSQGTGWFTVTPGSATVASGTPAKPVVTPKLAGLAPGVYNGQVTLALLPSGSLRRVAILLIVLPRASIAPFERGATGCTPAKLLPLFSLLGQSFTTAAAWPVSVEVTLVDDCGTSITDGSVVASFSSGDEPISLTNLKNGRFTGTWTPKNSLTASVTITASAQTIAPPLAGATTIGGSSSANPGVPLIKSGGVVNAASNASRIPLAPGSYMAIFGSGFASGLNIASLPFPTTLTGTQVLLSGKAIPLYFTSPGQINALVPYDTPTNTSHQLLVVNNNSYSVPEAVTFSDGGPGVFTADSTGTGAAIVQAYHSDGTPFVLNAASPATGGDVLVVYANGLGPVIGNVVAGTAAPSSPLASTINPVTATIQGKPAGVFFAGLVPTFAGLYQANVTVPAGLTASSSAELVLTVANQSSPPTTIPVK